MAFWSKSEPAPTAPDPDVVARHRMEAQVEKALAERPEFKVLTIDGLHWICPYSLALVPAPFGHREAAREHLVSNQPWKKQAQPHGLPVLARLRWKHHLAARWEDEPRLRLLADDRRWLNPYTGRLERLPDASGEGRDRLLNALSVLLAACPEAQTGKLLDATRLDTLLRDGARTPGDSGRVSSTTAIRRTSSDDVRDPTRSSRTLAVGTDPDLAKANAIIAKVLAKVPRLAGYGLSLHYEPHGDVGGDFYEIADLGDGRWLLLVGDVAGHGVQGAVVVVGVLKALRHLAKRDRDLASLLLHLNDDVRQDLVSGQFITCFAAILDTTTRTLECASAGHHPAALLSLQRPAPVSLVAPKGPALGLLSSSAFKVTLKTETVQLAPGDRLVVWTDGITEAKDAADREFGDHRLLGTLLADQHDLHHQAVNHVIERARNFALGSLGDDTTVLLLEVEEPI